MAGRIAGILMTIFVYLSSTFFYSLIPSLILSFLNNTQSKPGWLSDEDVTYFILMIAPITLLCSFSPRLTSLKYFAFLTTFIGLLITLIIVFNKTSYQKTYLQSGAVSVMFSFNMRLFGNYYLALLAWMNQFGVPSFLGELDRPTEPRIYRAIIFSKVVPSLCSIGIAVAGYSICGDQCPEFIINVKSPLEGSNLIMESCKLMLILCFMVNIVLRTQISHTFFIRAIQYLKQERNETEEEIESISLLREVSKEGVLEKQGSFPLHEPSTTLFFVTAVGNACIPVLFSYLIRRDFLKHMQSCNGLISPILMIVFPCRMTVRLHELGLMQASTAYIWTVKRFMEIFTVLSYVCLGVYLHGI